MNPRFVAALVCGAFAVATPATAAVPAPPSSLTVSPGGPSTLVLRWEDESANEDGFVVERESGGAWSTIALLPAGSEHHVDDGLASGESRSYRIRSRNSYGTSPAGDEASGTTTIRMNLVFFFADDMGYKDIVALRDPGVDGPTIYETPAVDQLASQGVSFTNAYCSGPRCVVARRAVQTGMYDYRPEAVATGGGIGPEMITIGEAMQAGGYRTCFIGKWHLGGKESDGDFLPGEELKIPIAQGYDVSIAAGEFGAPNNSYFETKKTAMAAELAGHPKAGTPFETDYTSRVRNIQDHPTYAAMMKSFDDSLASLRAHLAATDDPRNPGRKLSETTIVVLSSDHGGKSTDSLDPAPAEADIPTSNYPLRMGKTWCYEGGLQVPLIVYWPGVSQAGARCDAFVHGADFYRTFLDMTASPPVPAQHKDSVSFAACAAVPGTGARHESFHWFNNANTGTGNTGIGVYRTGDYKLVHQMHRRSAELYHLGECALGSSPTSGLQVNAPRVDATGATPVFEFTLGQDSADLAYLVEFSPDLANWDSWPPLPVVGQAGEVARIDLAMFGALPLFARLRVGVR